MSLCMVHNAAAVQYEIVIFPLPRQGLNWGEGDPAGSQIRYLLFEIHYL